MEIKKETKKELLDIVFNRHIGKIMGYLDEMEARSLEKIGFKKQLWLLYEDILLVVRGEYKEYEQAKELREPKI